MEASERSFSADDLEQAVDAYLLPEPTLRTDNIEVAARLHGSTGRSRSSSTTTRCRSPIPNSLPRDQTVDSWSPGITARSRGHRTSLSYPRRFGRTSNRGSRGATCRMGSSLGPEHTDLVVQSHPAREAHLRSDRHRRAAKTAPTHARILRATLGRRPGLQIRDPGQGRVEEPDLIERLRELSATPRLTWIELPDDDIVADELSRASAMLFPSEREGYGLPALEALALGCPVVVVEDLPALEGLSGERTDSAPYATVEALVTAIETLADPTSNAAYRAAIADLAASDLAAVHDRRGAVGSPRPKSPPSLRHDPVLGRTGILTSVTPLTSCRLCGSEDLVTVLDLGGQALTGVFPASVDERSVRGP